MAVAVAEELDLDVLGPWDELLEEDVGDAEGGPGLAQGLVDRGVEPVGRLDDPHPPAAAAHRGLDDDGIAQRLGHRVPGPGAGLDRLVAARQDRHARRWAMARAATLSPRLSSISGRGPTNAIPAASQARANPAFSERNPYPG